MESPGDGASFLAAGIESTGQLAGRRSRARRCPVRCSSDSVWVKLLGWWRKRHDGRSLAAPPVGTSSSMAEPGCGPVRRRRIGGTDRPVRRWSSPPRRACALGIMTLALWVALGGAAYTGAVTSGSVLTSTTAAIAQQTGVHVVFRANTGSSATPEKIVADVGVTTGQETVSEGQSHLVVRVTPGYAYVSGDSSGLTTIFGLTAAQAKKVGSHWVSGRRAPASTPISRQTSPSPRSPPSSRKPRGQSCRPASPTAPTCTS